jgi:tetratricopeptide (TPR) repeat protein
MYYNQGDSYKAIKNKLKVLKLENNPIEKRYNLISLWDSFNNVGLYEEGKKYAEKMIMLTGDSTYYYWTLLQLDYNRGNYNAVVKYAQKIYNTDSLNLGKLLGLHNSYFLGNTYVNLRNYREAYRILEKYTASMKQQGRKIQPYHYFGYVYLQNGRKKDADFHFDGFIKEIIQMMEQNKTTKKAPPNLGLTYAYAAIGRKEKALEHLRLVNGCPPSLYTCAQITTFKISPMIDCIRYESEYKEFLKNAEVRYLEEHDKVEKLLASEGILLSSEK